MILGLRYTRGDSWSLHDHHPKNNKRWKNFSNFWVEVHAGYNWSFHDHQLKNHEKWKFSDDIGVWGTRGGKLIPSRSPSWKPWKLKNSKWFFGLRYTWVTADPFTITILKPWELKKFQMIFWVEVHALCNWSLHDHHPKNHENWKNSEWFSDRGTRGGTADPFTNHQPENHEKWKTSDRFWVEVHAGDSWSFHDHHHKYHEKWNISDDFWFCGTRGWQLIPSRSPSWKQ